MKQRIGLPIIAGIAAVILVTISAPRSIPDLPNPPTTIRPGEKAQPLVDYAGLTLASLPGVTTSSVPNINGKATLEGTVRASGAPVEGATVVVDWFVTNTAVSSQRVITDKDGKWKLEKLLGGRYRVRAFKQPDLGVSTGQLFFLGIDESKTVNISLTRYSGLTVTPALSPPSPYLGEEANLGIRVTQATVSGNGVISATPVSGVKVAVTVSSPYVLLTPLSATTNANGDVAWTVRCDSGGNGTATFTVSGLQPVSMNLPPCYARVTTTTHGGSTPRTSIASH